MHGKKNCISVLNFVINYEITFQKRDMRKRNSVNRIFKILNCMISAQFINFLVFFFEIEGLANIC